mmetsp:Transcript_20827/g.17777  ORF Transcript_20827/g.17777 Transcript_20827/m.17777 type:complete len:115 (+) Transcript_20827:3-347(+)
MRLASSTRCYHKFVRPEAPNQDNLKKIITKELQPIAFEMQNDKNAGNYLYDKHYWGYICSPKFEGKTYKEMKEMLKELLDKCDMGEGRCRFKLEPPSRWEKLKRIRRRHFSLDR